MKTNLIFLLLTVCLIGNVIALDSLGTFKQGETVRISQVCSDATYINISSISYPNSTVAVSNIEMTSSGSGEYYYDFSLTDTAGRYDVRGVSDGCEETFATYLEITSSGQLPELTQALVNLILISFLILLVFVLYYSNSNINYEKWRNSIIKKYENRNYVKLTLSSILYNIMKNTFVLYYILGFPVILLITDMVYVFGINSMIEIMGIFLFLYTSASILVGIFLLSNVQEWIMDLLTEIKNMNWGI